MLRLSVSALDEAVVGRIRGNWHNHAIPRRLVVLILVVAVIAAGVASSASAALFFLFKPTTADAGDVVTVRLGGTPATFTLEQRKKPCRNGIRLYLVPSGVADEVTSRFDPRLHFIGRIVADRISRGVLSFRAPPLDSGAYALASWCPGCARYSFGRTFFVQTIPRVPRLRRSLGLRVRLPPATETCPVSGTGSYGNGLLSTSLPDDGILVARTGPDGLFQKLGWLPHTAFPDALSVRGERLDAASPPLRVLSVNWGYSKAPGRPEIGSWRSAVKFPSDGCWRITGRVKDISLSYVIKVVGGS